MKLKIRQPKMNPRTCQVWLDDHEVTHGLTGLEVIFDINEPTRAALHILVDDVDVDAQTLSVLEAHVKQREAEAEAESDVIEVTTYGDDTRRYVEVP